MTNALTRTVRPRLVRSALDRVLGGVCGGIGAHLGVSAWWIRLGFVMLTLALPIEGILIYLLAWVIMPIPTLADQPGAGRPRSARPEGTLLLGMAAIGLGILALAINFRLIQGAAADPVNPLLLALLGLALLARQIRRA